LLDYQYTLSLWWWLKRGALGRGKQKGHLTSALSGRPKFWIFESRAGLFWDLVYILAAKDVPLIKILLHRIFLY
jgi:hypothetical protein